MNISQLATKHKSDKGPSCHNYTALYESMFAGIREEQLTILEIGVLGGRSLLMWEEYFPNADIHGIDLNPECAKVDEGNTTTVWIGDQHDPDFLDKITMRLGGGFDIVIDDGSHRVEDQIFTFKRLWPNTRLIYVVEDTYTSYLKRYGGGYRRSGTAVEFFKDLVDDCNVSRFKDKPQAGLPRYYNDIGMIQFSPSLIAVYKEK